MALDFTGISNVNEFYSHHYLDSLLFTDLKGLMSLWQDKEDSGLEKPPYKRLSSLSSYYFETKAVLASTVTLKDRFDVTHSFNVLLAEALGYEREDSQAYELIEDDLVIPVLASLKRDGRTYLWLVEAPAPNTGTCTFDHTLYDFQIPRSIGSSDDDEGLKLPAGLTWAQLPALIFRRDEPPRWLILLAGSEVYLIERHKWGQGKYILFDIDELFGRRESGVLKVTAALLSRDAISPDDGNVLHDTLDENSHKHAFSVSSDLKFGIRHAVELLGNEYVWYMRNKRKKALFGDDELARELTRECLTYLYRLLFLFYAEARSGEMEIVPMKSDEYREGYSLEALRDLEQVPLTTEAAQSGYFLHESLEKLFRLVNKGYAQEQSRLAFLEGTAHDHGNTAGLSFPYKSPEASEDIAMVAEEAERERRRYLCRGFSINGLGSPLFDEEQTPLLRTVKFRNIVLQQVISLLSLSREGGRTRGRRRNRGRISYAQLGINQLGAVYEGLLSYSGFFAQETMYEVKTAGSSATDETKQSYFVPESHIHLYKDDEIVYIEDELSGDLVKRRKTYDKGTFIFRLAGRDRQKSASYYTPECLTRCVVKYSLRERIKGMKADDILKLMICEPAMGSGAFLNEVLGQLADAYLERKQRELALKIKPSEYTIERQRVMAHLAIHNCYGVDLNPMAVELARLSLWLNTIHKGARCPWFGLRLAEGNSLIGARREVFDIKDITRKNSRDNPNWLSKAPEAVAVGPEWKARPKDSVYHFLLPAEGMASFDKDKVIKKLFPDSVSEMRNWKKSFLAPLELEDARKLVELSDSIDDLWLLVVAERRDACNRSKQPVPLWGQAQPGETPKDFDKLEAIGKALRNSGCALRRLELVMDYWCSLFFWPLDKVDKLPSRDVFLMDLELIIKGTVTGTQAALPFNGQSHLELAKDLKKRLLGIGMVDVDALCDKIERLSIVRDVRRKMRFHHWELAFAEVFADNGGFDLIVGNPPWIKVEWNEGGILSECAPMLAIRKVSASNIAKERAAHIERREVLDAYRQEFVELTGSKSYLNDVTNYPLLKKVQTNLYKCFVTQSWRIGSKQGVAGFVHPEGIYDDPKGGMLRAAVYPRLRAHFQFHNELKLFADIGNVSKYSVNIYSAKPSDTGSVDIIQASNLFHPATVDHSLEHDGLGAVPGVKNADNEWDLRPHRSRVVPIQKRALEVFSALFDKPGTPYMEARLPVIHSSEILSVLEKFANQPRRLADLEGEYYATEMWHETNQQKDGTIRRETRYPGDAGEWILSGPHFHVGTPFNKTPNEGCKSNGDYSKIDLTAIPDDYLPRTNYVPACSPEEYLRRTPRFKGRPVTEFYRIAFRAMISPTGERSLVSSIIPRGCAHINGVKTIAISRPLVETCLFAGICSTIVMDFLVKVSGKPNLHELPNVFPWVEFNGLVHQELLLRVCKLNCIGRSYSSLWDSCIKRFPVCSFVMKESNVTCSRRWDSSCSLRRDESRRNALVELDVLAAHALSLTLDELLTIYRVQFPVLQQYERTNRYDRTGRLVPRDVLKIADKHGIDIGEPLDTVKFTGPKEIIGEVDTPGLGVTGGIRWEDPKMEPRMERIYPPPFTTHDREADMVKAYRYFEKMIKNKE